MQQRRHLEDSDRQRDEGGGRGTRSVASAAAAAGATSAVSRRRGKHCSRETAACAALHSALLYARQIERSLSAHNHATLSTQPLARPL